MIRIFQERLKKFSFSARFRGTWGHVSDSESPDEDSLLEGSIIDTLLHSIQFFRFESCVWLGFLTLDKT